MKTLQALTGFRRLSKKEQQKVKGGSRYMPYACMMEDDNGHCSPGDHCENGTCVPDNPSNGGDGGSGNAGEPGGKKVIPSTL